jgi:hypothetical protein
MTIVKTAQFRKNLKEILEKIYNGNEKDFFLDYYGKLFQIVPVNNDATKNKTQSQKAVEYFETLPSKKLTSPIFNEADAAQEKENFRKLIAGGYVK